MFYFKKDKIMAIKYTVSKRGNLLQPQQPNCIYCFEKTAKNTTFEI
jgi:hypothetical protein